MADYRQSISQSAAKELQMIFAKVKLSQLIKKIKPLATQPRLAGPKKLAGWPSFLSFIQGNYRFIYFVDDQSRVVNIANAGHGKDVYR